MDVIVFFILYAIGAGITNSIMLAVCGMKLDDDTIGPCIMAGIFWPAVALALVGYGAYYVTTHFAFKLVRDFLHL